MKNTLAERVVGGLVFPSEDILKQLSGQKKVCSPNSPSYDIIVRAIRVCEGRAEPREYTGISMHSMLTTMGIRERRRKHSKPGRGRSGSYSTFRTGW